MLEIMRKALKGWAGKSLIVLFTAPFLFIGAESFFSAFDGTKSTVEVNGEPISEQEVARAIDVNKQQIQQRFGKDFDTSLLSTEALREGALEQLVERELNYQYVEENKLNVSFVKLSEIIRELPFFTDDTGKFSQDVFNSIAAQQNVSPKDLIELIKKDITSSQPKEAITISSFTLPSEVKIIEQLRKQKRDIAYLILKLDDFRSEIEVSEEQITEYYQNHSPKFMSEESLTVEFLEISLADSRKEVTVSDELIQTRFAEEASQQLEQLERNASHILMPIDNSTSEAEAFKEIKIIKEKLNKGENFAELAKAFSKDSGTSQSGGNLGFAPRGTYSDEFEKVLYSLEKGQISEPVLTEFGYHIIQLTDIAQAKPFIFENEKARIYESLITASALELYQSKISKLEEIIFESSNLDAAAESLGLEIKVSKQFTRNSGEGIANLPEVRSVAFSEEVLVRGENSTVIEVGNSNAIVMHLKEHFPSTKKSLESVKGEIVLSIKTERAESLILEKKNEILSALNSGESTAAIAQNMNTEWIAKSEVTRRDVTIPQEIVAEVFKMVKPSEGKNTVSTVKLGTDSAIITLTKVHESNEVISQPELDQLTLRNTRLTQNNDWTRHMANLKSNADLVYKKESEEVSK